MKPKETMKWILFSFILCTVLSSCTYYEIKPPKVVVPDSVKFKANIIPIFKINCANAAVCHTTGGQAPNLSEANAYNSLMLYNLIDLDVPENSPIYLKITPPGTMAIHASETDRALILKWIQQGALDN